MSSKNPRREIPAGVKRAVALESRDTCPDCGRPFEPQRQPQFGHVVHRSLGGDDRALNLSLVCEVCNRRRSNRVDEQMRSRLKQLESARLAAEQYFRAAQVSILGNPRLRRPQLDGYLAIRDHLNGPQAGTPGLLEVPTGCGKTGLMLLAPFGVARGKVLMVAPNLTIRRTLDEALARVGPKSFLTKTHVLAAGERHPSYTVLETGRVNGEDCLRSEIVVANIQQLMSWIGYFDRDYFDLVLVDEGHHTPAESWQRLREYFPGARFLYFTATPFRSDGQPIVAESIYRFKLSEAMADELVKRVYLVEAEPAEMLFTIQGEDRLFTYVDILALKEEDWFSRSVALAEPCNLSIVEKSIEVMAKKRASGYPAQIIGAACSIDHAARVAGLYRERGVSATSVHSLLPEGDRLDRLTAFERGSFDCIIHVNVLGEGYDHPAISIAAIFRPFRSHLPFVQFVGRTLRRIEGASPAANEAVIVSHVGLNIRDLWDYFRREMIEANVITKLDELDLEIEAEGTADCPSSRSGGRPNAGRIEVKQETIRRYAVESYLAEGADVPDCLSRVAASPEFLEALRLGIIQVNTPPARPTERLASVPALCGNNPAREREAYRRVLDRRIKREAAAVVGALGIPDGASLVPIIGKGAERSNFEAVVRGVNRSLNQAMGREPSGSGRVEWSREELQRATQLVDRVASDVGADLRRRLGDAGVVLGPPQLTFGFD
jgi:DNA repair protein RadD